MDDERNTNSSEEMNEENDAREEDIVSDTDADTRDVEETSNADYEHLNNRISDLQETLDRVLGEVSALREAQGVMVENGAVINDVDDDVDDFTDSVDDVMDLLID